MKNNSPAIKTTQSRERKIKKKYRNKQKYVKLRRSDGA